MTEPRIVVDPITSLEIPVPRFASDEQAIERHRQLLDARIPCVEMYPEIGTRDVLWGLGTGPISARNIGASIRVSNELDAWQEWWERDSEPQVGWLSAADERAWLAEGMRLWQALSEELWWQLEIVPRFQRRVVL